ncbi:MULTISPECIES: nitrite reductase small subunit NirD [Acinetobacter]|uniref:Nitrite reductase [NAD(P)H], small subunit n=2 Tax=Acinetobacter TaxID=469 RepID=N9DE21_9GAMM|nr:MULTISPECIES: nitrite reductase small subunit NirD [Acinetobacter]ENV78980.1 nitrite reductase [NAD(P)H], small subunit [Acinetobacter ursingii ANC 3649]QXZ23807.1 nitrite reductase small subunit NirD [Acinetobacter septicus]
MTNLKDMNMLPENQWVDVCNLDDITPNTGVGALVEGQSVALFRVGHEKRIYALSNKDPFSQANVMCRGIIGDIQGERVIASPIYKQHFSLATGRCLEDKDQKLLVFPTKIENGRVWVGTVPQKTYITNNGISQDKLKLVLIGNGLAGMRCLEDLLDMAPERYEVTVIGEEPWGNYNRIMLSPVLSGEKTIEDIMLHPHAWYSDKGIKFIAQDPAVKIDRTRKVVHTEKGERIDYDRLIIATGSKPFIPPVQGADLNGVISFRDIYDVNTMVKYCETKKNAVVIGGGLLGLEAAYGLKQRGMNVTVLHLMDRIMDRQLDKRASEMLRHSIEQKGIQIITEANTEALLGKDGHVNQVRLKDGTILDADLVIFAVGIRPNIALAQSAGLRCHRGILVNDTMQTFDPSIYAVGECIEHRGQTFGLEEPLWGQAFICATHLAEHGSLTFKSPTVPTQLKVSGVDVFSAGRIDLEQSDASAISKEDYEDIILNDDKRQIYKRIIIQKDKVIGAVLFGDTEDGMWYAELIADQTPVSTFRNKLLFGKDFAMKKVS